MLKHITIVVLQDVQSEMKTEAEECQDVDIKHEQDVTHNLVAFVTNEKKVKDSVLLCIFILRLADFYLKSRDSC